MVKKKDVVEKVEEISEEKAGKVDLIEEDVEDVEDEVKPEAKLTDIPGIGPGIATKLESAGIYDLMGLAVMGPSD